MLEVAQAAKLAEGKPGALASPLSLLLLWTLADLANDKTRQCWHGRPALARASRLSERSIRYSLKALEADDHISTDLRPGRSTLYTIHPGKGCHPKPSLPRQEVPPPRQEVPVEPHKQTPARGADEPSNLKKEPGARLGEPDGPRAPGERRISAEHMAELQRLLSKAQNGVRA
jgi:hypothetical protein